MSDTVRIAAPDGAVREVQGVTGALYKSRDGMYEMHPADARALRAEGGFAPSLGSPRSGGFPCPCGFHSIFRKCSRCGQINDKDQS